MLAVLTRVMAWYDGNCFEQGTFSTTQVGANVLHVGGAFHAAVEVFGLSPSKGLPGSGVWDVSYHGALESMRKNVFI